MQCTGIMNQTVGSILSSVKRKACIACPHLIARAGTGLRQSQRNFCTSAVYSSDAYGWLPQIRLRRHQMLVALERRLKVLAFDGRRCQTPRMPRA